MKTWKSKLRKTYSSFEEFKAYSDTYGLAKRLGFKDAETAWEENPMIGGSVSPEDYGILKRGMR